MTGGAAERAIGTHRRVIVEEMRAMASWPRPPYASSSAFRFVYDRSASRDIADTSALAKQLGVLERAVTEQAFQPALGPEPGTLQPTQPDERGEPAERVSVGAVGAAVDSVIDRSAVPGAVIAPPSSDALPSRSGRQGRSSTSPPRHAGQKTCGSERRDQTRAPGRHKGQWFASDRQYA